MPITRKRRREKHNHKKSRKMRGGLFESSSPYFSSAKTQVQKQLGQAASAVYDRAKIVSDTASEAMKEQGVKILNELQSQATDIINVVKGEVNAIIDDALADLKIKASDAAKKAVAEALVAVKSQIKMV
jgi:hypothetical protein